MKKNSIFYEAEPGDGDSGNDKDDKTVIDNTDVPFDDPFA